MVSFVQQVIFLRIVITVKMLKWPQLYKVQQQLSY